MCINLHAGKITGCVENLCKWDIEQVLEQNVSGFDSVSMGCVSTVMSFSCEFFMNECVV